HLRNPSLPLYASSLIIFTFIFLSIYIVHHFYLLLCHLIIMTILFLFPSLLPYKFLLSVTTAKPISQSPASFMISLFKPSSNCSFKVSHSSNSLLPFTGVTCSAVTFL